MKSIKCKVTLEKAAEANHCWVTLPFDPKEQFGKVRAPVVVTIGRYAFRTTIFSMGGRYLIGIRKEHRDAAGVKAGDTLSITVAPDTAPRTVTPPPDLKKALKGSTAAQAVWETLSYTHKREYVEWIEEAKKPETRLRRLEKTIEQLLARS